jgi:hypothetical protein
MYFAQINGGGGSAISKPKDLHIPTGNTTKDDEIKELKLGKDYFDIVIQDLLLNTEYSFQFAWKYEDGSYSEWSASKTFSTSLESAPAVPSQPTVTAGPGLINVTWNGNNAAGTTLQNYEKVNIYVGGTYKDSFFASGTKSIPLAKGTYSVTLRSSSSTNVVSNATSPAVSVTVTSDSTDATAALSGLDNKISISASSIVNPTTKQLTAIDTAGITVYSGSSATSGARVAMNSLGIAAYNSSNVPTFSIEASTGNAYFKGEIQSSSGTIGGWTIGSDKIYSSNIEFQTNNDPVLGYPSIKFFAGNNYNIYAFANFFGITNSTNNQSLIVANDTTVPGTMFLGGSGYMVRNSNTTIDNKQLRNIYVSSTAGEPSPSSPATGDIKLEW